MGRSKIRQLTPRSWFTVLGMILIILIVLSWISLRFIRPFPPHKLVMATGMAGGSYAEFGEHYRRILARDGIQLILRSTAGAVENLKLLEDESQTVDAGFVQGSIGRIEERSNLVSLGSVAYTPLWVFYRGPKVMDDLSQMRGKKIAIGPEGSGVRTFSLELLKTADISGPPAVIYELPYTSAKEALIDGRIDVIMMFGSTDNQIILELLQTKDIRLMDFSLAEAYTRHFPDLLHVILPKGVINPAKRFPPADVNLISPTTNLIVRKNLHPALVYLLLKASVEIHGGAGWVNKAGEFPSITKQDDPISEQARNFYKSGGSWFYAYLPFWAATFLDRIILILIPLGMVIVPLIGIAPWIYTWRNRSKYYPWYRELRNIEKELTDNQQPEKIDEYESKLDRIEEAVNSIHTSVAFY
ncbi:MAG: TAXI family TRAP transporter solute-binding subunit, partial [Syntrophales bacterium]|nr:TAXI family TRAP transporter solute-binding subunit [Syntrophales bacterium]